MGSTFTFHFTNATLIDPYKQIDPSRLFGGYAPNLGTINGLTGTDFIFQADANGSFVRTVPEPASLVLLGVGLAAAGAFSRRRTQA